jgi:hypothetical protein
MNIDKLLSNKEDWSRSKLLYLKKKKNIIYEAEHGLPVTQ